MRRREFVSLLGGTATASTVWTAAGRAQQKAMAVIGYLSGGTSDGYAPYIAAFREALSETGYVEGKNLTIEYRWAEGRYDRLPELAADIVGRKVDVIMAGGLPAARAAKVATSTIPIVFSASDPVGSGLVASLARPGGNITGGSSFSNELESKRLELLSELAPQARTVAVLVNSGNAGSEAMVRDAQEAARVHGLQIVILNAGSENDIDAAFASLVQDHAGALVVAPDAFLTSRRSQLVALAARYSVPAIYSYREFAASGGLISYGSSLTAVWRRIGIYAGRILNGAKPADLPVQQPTAYDLVINLKTAKELGVTVPPSILARADEVIE